MARIQKGQIGLIQFDPSNLITYDVFRFWRHELAKRPQLGAAGQSLLLFTALPYGEGYNASSPLMNGVRFRFYT